MHAIAKTSRSSILGALVAAVVLFSAGRALAASNPTQCTNDVDCKATPQCGGEVCTWPARKCMAAGAAAAGSDGWCAQDSDCKCMGAGATCNAPYCTFTVAPGGTGGTTGSGGTTGAGGTTATGGTTGTGGTTASGGSTGAAGSGSGGAGPTSSGSSGGCAVSPSSGGLAGALLGLALVVTGLARRRRA